jgi:hypothetical protein
VGKKAISQKTAKAKDAATSATKTRDSPMKRRNITPYFAHVPTKETIHQMTVDEKIEAAGIPKKRPGEEANHPTGAAATAETGKVIATLVGLMNPVPTVLGRKITKGNPHPRRCLSS